MKLHEIKHISIVSEGMVEPNLMLSIQNIIKRGHADNNFEFLCLARVIQLLKCGDLYRNSNPLFDGNFSTSKELLDHLRVMPPTEIKDLAEKLLSVLQLKDADVLSSYEHPTQEYLTWLKLFTAREAND